MYKHVKFTYPNLLTMKNIFFLLTIAISLLSCSNDSDSTSTSKKILKVVFYKNSSNERHWIIDNNLLKSITLSDGTVVEEFIYDSQSRLIRDVKYNNGLVIETDVITYNADNTIKTINGLPYTFNIATQTYEYTYGSSFTIIAQVNSDKLVVNYTRTGSNPKNYQLIYANGNMISFEKANNNATELTKNFRFDSMLGENPIYNAVLAVARVKSLTDPNFFIDNPISKNIPNGFDKGVADPNYYNYGAMPDAEGKLLQIGVEVLDNNNNFIEFYSFADYYFQ